MDEQNQDQKPQSNFMAKVAGFILNIRVGKLFWGGLLLIIGALALLNNFGVVEARFGNLWRLWPLVIVAVGLSVLSLKGLVSRLITILFVLAALAAVFIMSISDGQVREHRITTASVGVFEDVTNATVSFSGGAGPINVTSQPQGNLVEASLDSNFAELEYAASQEGTFQIVDLKAVGSERWWLGDWNSRFEMSLLEGMPINLILDVGATNLSADFSELVLEDLNINAGASSLDLRFGDIVDLLNVSLNVGASSMDIYVPEGMGLRVSISSSLSEFKLPDSLVEVSDGVYESRGYTNAAKKINISGSTGVSSLNIEHY
ncbi:MAG: DUF5668 domain-containing protein, partial [Candidatus Saccharimonadales bacterium]